MKLASSQRQREDSRRIHAAVGYRARHGRNHADAARRLEPHHLTSRRLRRHEASRHVNREHALRLLDRVVERGRLKVDASGRNQPVQLALGVGNGRESLVERGHVAHVDLVVLERGAELVGGSLGYAREVAGGVLEGRGEAIDAVDCKSIELGFADWRKYENQGCQNVPVAPASSRASACTRPRPRAPPDTTTTLSCMLKSGSR